MRVSQLLYVMEKDDTVIIDDAEERIDRMRIYDGPVRGIKRDDLINRMHVHAICADDDQIKILAATPKRGDGNAKK